MKEQICSLHIIKTAYTNDSFYNIVIYSGTFTLSECKMSLLYWELSVLIKEGQAEGVRF